MSEEKHRTPEVNFFVSAMEVKVADIIADSKLIIYKVDEDSIRE